jgi:hypothetical protein
MVLEKSYEITISFKKQGIPLRILERQPHRISGATTFTKLFIGKGRS